MQELTNQAKQKFSKSDWVKILSEWEKSGEKQKPFCNGRNLSYSTFGYWHRQLEKKKRPIKELNSFAAVKATSAVTTSAFKINLPNGIYFTIPPTPDKASLKLIFELLDISRC